ncbi:carboxysome peptide B [Thioalkalicoccus limnaeus]|uniref:Carboxysome peptide B n=1 Tax=Thioalkalicoccus limnaeus TaxID=120681 RepID=A0ABV4B9P1_9GAMM
MEIRRVVGSLVCTQRIAELAHVDLRVLQDAAGRRVVATDPVGARPDDWVFVVSGSAARYAMGNPAILTDLTVGGVIDHWPPEAASEPSSPPHGTPRR